MEVVVVTGHLLAIRTGRRFLTEDVRYMRDADFDRLYRPRRRGSMASWPTAPATPRSRRICWRRRSSGRCGPAAASTAGAAPAQLALRDRAEPPARPRAPLRDGGARGRARRRRRARVGRLGGGRRRAPRRAPARAGDARGGGARGDRAALRRRSDRPEMPPCSAAALDRRGPRVPRPASSASASHPAVGWAADRARRGCSGALYPQSALAGLNSLPREAASVVSAPIAASMAGSRPMSAREPGQVRKEAALSGHR